MKKLVTIILLSSTLVGKLYCQESNIIAPQKGDWGISTDASNIINIINGYSSEGVLRGKYLFSDQFAILGGLSFAGYSYSEFSDSHNTNTIGLELGGQYFFPTDKRVRPFVGIKISYSSGINKEKNEDTSNTDIFTSPFYAYVGIGAEYFLTRNISLSTDFGLGIACTIKRMFTMTENGNTKDVDMDWFFCYATGMGGLGGKLALNIYF